MVSIAGKGAEFRDDERRRTGLAPEVVKRLTRINPLKATFGVFETASLSAAALAAALYWWMP